MDEEDLVALRKDLISGNMERLIRGRLNRLRGFDDKTCPVCGQDVDESDYILEFGDQMRKRAFFDEKDCLTYFLDERL